VNDPRSKGMVLTNLGPMYLDAWMQTLTCIIPGISMRWWCVRWFSFSTDYALGSLTYLCTSNSESILAICYDVMGKTFCYIIQLSCIFAHLTIYSVLKYSASIISHDVLRLPLCELLTGMVPYTHLRAEAHVFNCSLLVG
jgi:hypothetical protein